MLSISYAILVNDELKEIKELCSLLINYKHPEDEIIIVQDVADVEDCSDSKLEVYEYLMNLSKDELIKYYQRPLNNNFAEQKNYLNSKCSKDYIFNLDADETVSPEFIAEYIKLIIELNLEVEAF
jgi:hypothetical protein